MPSISNTVSKNSEGKITSAVRGCSLVFADSRSKAHDDGRQCRLDVRVGVSDKLFQTWQNVGHHNLLATVSRQIVTEICTKTHTRLTARRSYSNLGKVRRKQ